MSAHSIRAKHYNLYLHLQTDEERKQFYNFVNISNYYIAKWYDTLVGSKKIQKISEDFNNGAVCFNIPLNLLNTKDNINDLTYFVVKYDDRKTKFDSQLSKGDIIIYGYSLDELKNWHIIH